ncbi:ATP-binding cassette domain-containing protein [Maricaulaceae bacterium NA33B04]|nr:ATP-binding cassette domain-containing protein [Maricaulaceae bacterium NA33B04]
MSMRLTATGLSLHTPDHRLLWDQLDLSLGGEVVGVVGPNGSGKSSLLQVLAGTRLPTTGQVTCDGHRLLLEQVGRDIDGCVAEGLGIAEDLERLMRITEGLANEPDFDIARWTLPVDAEAALARMGLSGLELDRPLNTLSGGQRARVVLASAWLERREFLLMDEPTNNLDGEGRDAVYAMLADWPGGILVASHDRALLGHVDRILALEQGGWSLFGGNGSDYLTEKAAREERAELAFERAEAHLKATRRAEAEAKARLARRARTGKALRRDGSNAKSLLDAMKSRSEATVSRISGEASRRSGAAESAVKEADLARTHRPKLNVKAPGATALQGRTELAFESVSFGYGSERVVEDLSFALSGGDRVALTGPNGSGKTTVLKLAVGLIDAQAGRVVRSNGRIARLDQMVSDLSPELTAAEALRHRYPALSVNAAYAALAQFDLRAKAAEKPVSVLSGGERLRVGLAGALGGEPPSLLLLDEPTNHLDLDALSALEAALRDYRGTVLAVSHDTEFLNQIGIERRISLPPIRRLRR